MNIKDVGKGLALALALYLLTFILILIIFGVAVLFSKVASASAMEPAVTEVTVL